MTSDDDATRLRGLRVLVVEDSYFVAVGLAKLLRGLGCSVVGPAPTVAIAMELLEREAFDVALLDINLGSETAEPVAAALNARQRPFLFVTGYSSPRLLGSAFQTQRRLMKPVTVELLREALGASMQ